MCFYLKFACFGGKDEVRLFHLKAHVPTFSICGLNTEHLNSNISNICQKWKEDQEADICIEIVYTNAIIRHIRHTVTVTLACRHAFVQNYADNLFSYKSKHHISTYNSYISCI